MTDRWFDKEIEQLERDLEEGRITQAEYIATVREMEADIRDQEYRRDMINAGRGHLLR